MSSAKELRDRFRRLPKADREAHQGFSIRVWRALSWLERAEDMETSDIEGRFISCWIGLNALYGRLDKNHRSWGDREAMGTFLANIWKLDHGRCIHALLGKRKSPILHLIDDKYLSSDYWELGRSEASRSLQKDVRKAIMGYTHPNRLPLLQLLFDRLYVMRNQVFHGASTKGSRLNRRTLTTSANILLAFLAACLGTMIDHGLEEDWGRVCFPPKD